MCEKLVHRELWNEHCRGHRWLGMKGVYMPAPFASMTAVENEDIGRANDRFFRHEFYSASFPWFITVPTANSRLLTAMFVLPAGYATAQNAGSAFATGYYDRLNWSADSLPKMFATGARYYSMDSLDGQPAVGRADAARAARRFRDAHADDGRRSVQIASVDAQTDDPGDFVDDGGDDDDRRENVHWCAVFAVFAKWTDRRRPIADVPFVQTFRVRRVDGPRRRRFQILDTVVKVLTEQHSSLRPPAIGKCTLKRGAGSGGGGRGRSGLQWSLLDPGPIFGSPYSNFLKKRFSRWNIFLTEKKMYVKQLPYNSPVNIVNLWDFYFR